MAVENGNQDAANLVGKTLGQYEIISILGQGGMATVYKAYQPSLERHIALKVLLPHFAEPEFVARFKREALAAARLSHPNVVHIYDAGETEGRYYIAMEYIGGGTLKDRLDERGQEPLDAPTIAQVVEGIGGALAFAHRNGIVHRDVKPGNIMFTRGGRVVLSDLGLAKFFEAADLTQMTAVIGTPFYMSPEQARSQVVDTRSDIYSFGVVIYEMLTGHVPFEADTPWMAIHQHIYEAPPPIRQMNPVVSEAVAGVVEKALAKLPGDRYQHIEDMVSAFLSAQKRPTSAPTSLTDQVRMRAGEAPRERRGAMARSPVWVFVAGALIVITLVSALVFWGINQLSASRQTAAARTFTSTATPTLSIATATSTMATAIVPATTLPAAALSTATMPVSTEVPPSPTLTYSPAPPTATETIPPPTTTDTPVPPTPTPSPTATRATATQTREPSPTRTATAVLTETSTATATIVPPTLTETPELVTETPTDTPVLTPTNTQAPPTDTQAPPPPTATDTQAPPPPTATDTQAPPPPTATNTQAPPPPTATNTQAPPPPTATDTQAPPPPTATNTQPPPPPTATQTPRR